MPSDAGPSPDPGPKPLPSGPAPSGAVSTADPGLPPVAPPSGRFILQLFLVPGLIVAGLVLIWILLNLGAGDLDRKLKNILARLDNPNPEERWRGAEDLARELPSNEQMSLHVGFALDLAERLRGALSASEANERARLERVLNGGQSAAEEASDLKALESDRKFLLFLTACQGYFRAPVGAPLLAEMALPQPGIERSALHDRREFALFALSSLGDSLNKFDALSEDKQEELMRSLKEETENQGERGRLARRAHAFLSARLRGRASGALGVTPALVHCAFDSDPYFRKLAALAMGFWEDDGLQPMRGAAGIPALAATGGAIPLLLAASLYPGRGNGIEEALRQLARDDGRGAKDDERVRERREIRYNATLALARRGSPAIKPLMPVLEEMLDREKQEKLCKPPAVDNALVIVRGTLKAVARLHRKNRALDLSTLHAALDRLVDGDNTQLAEEAEEVRKLLKE